MIPLSSGLIRAHNWLDRLPRGRSRRNAGISSRARLVGGRNRVLQIEDQRVRARAVGLAQLLLTGAGNEQEGAEIGHAGFLP